jgi:hypothetical protein
MNAVTNITPLATRPEPPAMIDMDVLVEKYVALRDKRDEIRKGHQEIEARFKAGLDFLEGQMHMILQATGQTTAGTPHGTAFEVTQTSATVQDWTVTLDFILEHKAWDLLEARVSKLAVERIMADSGQPVPGVKVSQRVTVNVRRPTKRAS